MAAGGWSGLVGGGRMIMVGRVGTAAGCCVWLAMIGEGAVMYTAGAVVVGMT